MKQTLTGDTLCDPSAPVLLEEMMFPTPVIDVAIEPKSKVDSDKLGNALQKLSEEDPTFRVHTDEDTGQTIISGMGELHLEVLVDRLIREFKVGANVGKPQVAYRETIKNPVEKVETRYVKQTGGKGQYAHVVLEHRADRSRRGLRVHQQDHRWTYPERVHPQRGPGRPGGHGLRCARRLPGGRPARDAAPTAPTTTSTHPRWRSRSPVRCASRTQSGRPKPVLLEPIFDVEVVTPEEYMGDVIGDLSGRRGRIESMDQRGTDRIVKAQVPLAEMFGYATELRSRTQGRATYTMQFNSYQEVPKSIADDVVAAVRGEPPR